jgi:ribosomal-protein-alanine N-acetyltransferase
VNSEALTRSCESFLDLKPLTPELIPAAVELDQLCFGGLWTLAGYQRELESPNSDLLVLTTNNRQEKSFECSTSNPKSNTPQNPKPKLSSTEKRHEQNPKLSSVPLLGLGCLWAILEEAHITILAIHPDYQRQGLGQALLYALMVSAQRRGLERATLEVRVSNQSALALYQKFGFQEAGRRRRYYEDTGEDALILWRGGLQHPEFQQTLLKWQGQVGDRLQPSGWSLSAASLSCEKTP